MREALVAAVLIAASSCTAFQAIPSMKPLPAAEATLHWASIDLPRGSYCWRSGSTGECADAAGTDDLVRTGYLRPYRTAGGFDVKITFHSDTQPTNFAVELIRGPNGLFGPMTTIDTYSFHLGASPPAAAGIYIYGISAKWSEGDVSFFLPLDLIPGVA